MNSHFYTFFKGAGILLADFKKILFRSFILVFFPRTKVRFKERGGGGRGGDGGLKKYMYSPVFPFI